MPASYGIDRILRLLPHRYPFLLVDRVLEAAEDGVYFLNAAPLNLGGADGAPCRAWLMTV